MSTERPIIARKSGLKQNKKPTRQRLEQDSPWKSVIGGYFQDFMAFFFPAIHRDVDWAKGYDQLDTELARIKRGSKRGKRLADKLVKVYLVDG